MQNPEKYRKIIKKILTEYYQMTVAQVKAPKKFEVRDRLAFDEIRDQYLWFRNGMGG
ncbi:MAG: element excision factor XisI family protein [Limnoraphis robusta]|uniref:element excision factor XisI family protein n=1 Tax=Limnoraphis robusta TaxID=1118279 RepID=UPI001F3A47C3|nr:element excision factor XisI family protein [Limnoraphis robusta]MEA5539390.1 element excision factor XisI family protein [Limnoraphis robusta Tam1]